MGTPSHPINPNNRGQRQGDNTQGKLIAWAPIATLTAAVLFGGGVFMKTQETLTEQVAELKLAIDQVHALTTNQAVLMSKVAGIESDIRSIERSLSRLFLASNATRGGTTFTQGDPEIEYPTKITRPWRQ